MTIDFLFGGGGVGGGALTGSLAGKDILPMPSNPDPV